MSDLYESVNGNYEPKKLNEEFNENEWAKESNDRLKQSGSKKKVVNATWHTLLLGLFIVNMIVLGGFVMWGIYNDKFSTEIIQDFNFDPNVLLNNTFNNRFENTVENTYRNNITVVNQINLDGDLIDFIRNTP